MEDKQRNSFEMHVIRIKSSRAWGLRRLYGRHHRKGGYSAGYSSFLNVQVLGSVLLMRRTWLNGNRKNGS